MDENLNSQTSSRFSGISAPVERVSTSFPVPGQNAGFSDGFPTKSLVVARHSGQPGKSTDPKNPMKSNDDPPRKGFPPPPPTGWIAAVAASWFVVMVGGGMDSVDVAWF